MKHFFWLSLLCSLLLATSVVRASQHNQRPGPLVSTDAHALVSGKTVRAGAARVSAGGERIKLIFESDDDAELERIFQRKGADVQYRYKKMRQLFLPRARIQDLLSDLPEGVRVRQPFPHHAASVVSAGVHISGADEYHALGVDGSGIKVGIIDIGFYLYPNAQASGDLPANLTFTDYSGYGVGYDSHGTKVAEIVHDMAPGAELYLARVSSSPELEQAVSDMIAAGVSIINHSVAWYGAGFYDGTGSLCDIADMAELANVQWVNSAGNARFRHYLNTFTDSNSDLEHEFLPGQPYNIINVGAGNVVQLVLNWDDYPLSNVDYDMELYFGDPASGGTLVAQSKNSQAGSGNTPMESIYYVSQNSGLHYIVIRKKNSGEPHLPMTLFSRNHDLTTRTLGTSLVHMADCIDALAVAAVGTNDALQGWSSEGPTTNGLAKPEIAGISGVAVSVGGSFAGTSAAAPYVAGMMALMLDANPSLNTQQLRAMAMASTEDVGEAGFDYRTGYGRISLDADGDGVNHDHDNCPLVLNDLQEDNELDGLGDACDDDDDNDGLSDVTEAGLGTNPFLADTDMDQVTDDIEVAAGTDPLDELDFPGSGDLNLDGLVNAGDLLLLSRFVLNVDSPSQAQIARADLAPLSAGIPAPDGVLDAGDLLIMQRLIMQLVSF